MADIIRGCYKIKTEADIIRTGVAIIRTGATTIRTEAAIIRTGAAIIRTGAAIIRTEAPSGHIWPWGPDRLQVLTTVTLCELYNQYDPLLIWLILKYIIMELDMCIYIYTSS